MNNIEIKNLEHQLKEIDEQIAQLHDRHRNIRIQYGITYFANYCRQHDIEPFSIGDKIMITPTYRAIYIKNNPGFAHFEKFVGAIYTISSIFVNNRGGISCCFNGIGCSPDELIEMRRAYLESLSTSVIPVGNLNI